MKRVPKDNIDVAAAKKRAQRIAQFNDFEIRRHITAFVFHQKVNVTIRSGLAARNRTEQGQSPDVVRLADFAEECLARFIQYRIHA
jgi:hypothetical protein